MADKKINRVDERDVIFARMDYKEGSPEYEDYYNKNPHKKETDKALRALPQMGGEGTATYDPINSPIANACFRFLADIKDCSEGQVQFDKDKSVAPDVMTRRIKGMAGFFNAKLVGITRMQPYHYYSHRGRPEKSYGQKIDGYHKFGIAFAVEMDKEMIFRAPQLSEAVAVTKGYVEAAVIGMVLSYYIRELGFDARNHMDGNYLVIAPLVAMDAGLGGMGRNGLLITKKYGPRVRLGVVTTDMPLVEDARADLGIAQFCRECERCVRTCPGQAIPSGPETETGDVSRWKIDPDRCYQRWRVLGTDCGVCLASCPFSDEIPEEYMEKLKTDQGVRKEILENHEKKHGVRPYIKDKPKWMQP